MNSSEESPVLISNIEVLKILQKRLKTRQPASEEVQQQKNPRRKQRQFRHRDWVEQEVATYLESTPCVAVDEKRYPEFQKKLQSQKKQLFAAESSKSTGFGLTEAESIQILNFMPTEPVEIHLMVEELHGRMVEKQQEELLETIGSYRKANKDNNTHENNGEMAIDDGQDASKDEAEAAPLPSVKEEQVP